MDADGPDESFLENVNLTMRQKVEELLVDDSGLVEVISQQHQLLCERVFWHWGTSPCFL